MEVRVLRYFLMIVQEQNITKAARLLHITQPTLSRQMMQLEEQLGVTLFVRKKNNIVLTDEGMLLKRRAEEIVDLVNKTEKELLIEEKQLAGEIFIGAAETKSMHNLASIMKEVSNAYPLITYNTYSGNADDIKDRIDKGLIDVGLLTEPVDINKYEFIRLPEKERWGILLPKTSPLAKKDFITPEDLMDKPLLISQRFLVQNEIINWLQMDSNHLHIVGTYNLIYNAAVMVEHNIGFAVCLESLINSNEETNTCFKLFYPKLETGSVLVWKKNQIFSPVTSKFIEMIKNALKA
ncbi:MAG: LysR family transcriptional regulator [Coprobacillaceae bacterium]